MSTETTESPVEKTSLYPDAFHVGMKIFIHTVTLYFIGTIKDVERDSTGKVVRICLLDCSWVANTERFHLTVLKGALKESEPFLASMPVWIEKDAIVASWQWLHNLPEEAIG